MMGLKNRFPEDVKYEWSFHYSCMVCGRNGFSELHHIISPTVRFYKTGKFNKSILNSCPIHHENCHIANEWYLHKDENIKILLSKTYKALMRLEYELKPIDIEFKKQYNELYN